MTATPFVQHIQRPGTGPCGFTCEEIVPNILHSAGPQYGRQYGCRIRETGLKLFSHRATEPFFPRQGKRALFLPESFSRQQVANRFHEQRFLRSWPAPRRIGQSPDKFRQRGVQHRNAYLERLRHTHGVRVTQQRARHVTAHLQPRDTRYGSQLARFVGGPLQPAEPRRLERHAIGPDGAWAKSRLDNLLQLSWRKQRASKKIRMRESIGRDPSCDRLAPCIRRTAASG